MSIDNLRQERVETCEKRREEQKPPVVQVLFVGESIPQRATHARDNFFYFCNSLLYGQMRLALSAAFNGSPRPYGRPCIENGEDDFLTFLWEKGWYLTDLCSAPVNHLGKTRAGRTLREYERICGIPLLSTDIRKFDPEVIVVIMKDICPHVLRAACQAEVGPITLYNVEGTELLTVGSGSSKRHVKVYALPFPSYRSVEFAADLKRLAPTLPKRRGDGRSWRPK
jgi:hypothetical protein